MTEHQQSHLRATSKSSDEVAHLFDGHFDLMVLFPSWDGRCICIDQADKLTADNAIIFDFTHKGTLGLREKHDPIVRAYATRATGKALHVTGKSEDLAQLWEQLREQVLRVYLEMGRPLNVFIDLSSSPRYYSLGLLAYGIGQGIVKEASFLYAEATYKDPTSGQLLETFTTGRWETVTVPQLLGSFDPEKRRHYHISLGFEGPKTLRVVTRAEPDHVSALFPDPGYDPSYLETTTRNNADLLEQFGVVEERIVRAPAGDAIAAWRLMEGRNLDVPERFNTYYVCSGTKPHSLALALRAMALGYPTVLYNKPGRHRESLIDPSGRFWRFDIVDVSAIT
jgi:hypothetical protein